MGYFHSERESYIFYYNLDKSLSRFSRIIHSFWHINSLWNNFEICLKQLELIQRELSRNLNCKSIRIRDGTWDLGEFRHSSSYDSCDRDELPQYHSVPHNQQSHSQVSTRLSWESSCPWVHLRRGPQIIHQITKTLTNIRPLFLCEHVQSSLRWSRNGWIPQEK